MEASAVHLTTPEFSAELRESESTFKSARSKGKEVTEMMTRNAKKMKHD